MLTTVDNPYNPYNEWDAWLAYDTRQGYHTTAYLARIVHSSDELSEADQDAAIDSAIDEILEHDELNMYRRVEDPSQVKSESI